MNESQDDCSDSEVEVLRSSLAGRIGVQNIADFLGRDLNEVLERIGLVNEREASAEPTAPTLTKLASVTCLAEGTDG